jgi:hypothetical protein
MAPRQFEVVDDWPPQDVRIMRPEKPAPNRRLRRRSMLIAFVILATLATFLYESGFGSAIVGVRHVAYGNGWGSSASIETYGEPRVHIFRPNQPHAPYLTFAILNTSRWTITVTGVDTPLDFTQWEIRGSTDKNWIDPARAVRLQPTVLRPGTAMQLYFLGKPIRCVVRPSGGASGQSTDTLTVRYRVAGITRAAELEGHRFVYTNPDGCNPS